MFAKSTIRGYWQLKCHLCDGKALYHCGGKGYCRDHRYVAVNRRKAVRDGIFEKRDNTFAAMIADSDRERLSRERAKKNDPRRSYRSKK
jgi:hypothetical protein